MQALLWEESMNKKDLLLAIFFQSGGGLCANGFYILADPQNIHEVEQAELAMKILWEKFPEDMKQLYKNFLECKVDIKGQKIKTFKIFGRRSI